jgi:hypothetical protein
MEGVDLDEVCAAAYSFFRAPFTAGTIVRAALHGMGGLCTQVQGRRHTGGGDEEKEGKDGGESLQQNKTTEKLPGELPGELPGQLPGRLPGRLPGDPPGMWDVGLFGIVREGFHA